MFFRLEYLVGLPFQGEVTHTFYEAVVIDSRSEEEPSETDFSEAERIITARLAELGLIPSLLVRRDWDFSDVSSEEAEAESQAALTQQVESLPQAKSDAVTKVSRFYPSPMPLLARLQGARVILSQDEDRVVRIERILFGTTRQQSEPQWLVVLINEPGGTPEILPFDSFANCL